MQNHRWMNWKFVQWISHLGPQNIWAIVWALVGTSFTEISCRSPCYSPKSHSPESIVWLPSVRLLFFGYIFLAPLLLVFLYRYVEEETTRAASERLPWWLCQLQAICWQRPLQPLALCTFPLVFGRCFEVGGWFAVTLFNGLDAKRDLTHPRLSILQGPPSSSLASSQWSFWRENSKLSTG